ncbi:MAG: ion transporter [bacterium]
MTTTPETGQSPPSYHASFARRCRAISESGIFQMTIFGVILANAVVLGLGTYDSIEREAGSLLQLLNEVFLGIFVLEILTRIAAYGKRPQDFFKNGWNVFDFVVVFAAFVPGVRENATLLRLVRLLRVVRVISVLPDLRVLISGMGRALPPIGAMAVLAVLLLFTYGMIGWELFGDALPERWGDIGQAMLTLFTVLTLEGWNEILFTAQEVHPESWIFFVSFVLIASFLLINILIAIIINSVEEARNAERAEAFEDRLEEAEKRGEQIDPLEDALGRIDELKGGLEELRSEVAAIDLHERREAGAKADTRDQTRRRLRPSGRRGRGM